jgi:mediator of RNA polymerase II transcription subunit 5
LTLFQLYPADLSLEAYIRCALNAELLSLPTFVVTFLQATKSPSVQDVGTIDMLCKLIREVHTNSRLPLVAPYQEESAHTVLEILQESLGVLHLCLALPYHFSHQATASVAWLVDELHKCIVDFSQITTTQAMIAFTQVFELLNSNNFDTPVQDMLLHIGNKLRLILGDDVKMAQEAQMMQTIQLTYGKGDALGPNSPTDIVTCSLILRHLVSRFIVCVVPMAKSLAKLSYRTSAFSSAHANMALVMLLATFRSTLWTPAQFYTQLFLSAFHCMSQSVSQRNTAILWKSFIVTRVRSSRVVKC